jgi:hypothetical protein
MDRISVIHQEIILPKSFSEFIVTKYDAYVNGIKLNDKTVVIDDYSSNERIIHLLVFKQDLETVLEQGNYLKPEMNFTLSPSNETGFPIVQYTKNYQFKVSLSWDPPKITPNSTTQFSFQIMDPYVSNKTVDSIDFDFTILAGKMGPIFHSIGKTNSNGGMNTVKVNMPTNYTGSITIAFEKLNGNKFADSEFTGVISNPSVIPEFSSASLLVVAIVFFSEIAIKKLIKY